MRVGLRHYVEARFVAMEKSIEAAKGELDVRLAGMNEWRQSMTDLTAQFPTRAELQLWREKVELVIADYAKRMGDNEKRIQAVEQVAALVKWIAGVVVLMMVGLVWAILTHTIELLPK